MVRRLYLMSSMFHFYFDRFYTVYHPQMTYCLALLFTAGTGVGSTSESLKKLVAVLPYRAVPCPQSPGISNMLHGVQSAADSQV